MTQGAQTGLCDSLEGGLGWEVGGRVKRKGDHMYTWLIHLVVWQNPTQYCKATSLQVKTEKSEKKKIA